TYSTNKKEEGAIYATRNGGFGKNGRQHGAAAHERGPQLRGLRYVAKISSRTGEGERSGVLLTAGFRQQTHQAAGNLADDPGWGCGPDHCRDRSTSGGR